ncbi:MAG: hypothetical protein AVDCRST_MAG86-2628, partial [uncultured Truepera sp.]
VPAAPLAVKRGRPLADHRNRPRHNIHRTGPVADPYRSACVGVGQRRRAARDDPPDAAAYHPYARTIFAGRQRLVAEYRRRADADGGYRLWHHHSGGPGADAYQHGAQRPDRRRTRAGAV